MKKQLNIQHGRSMIEMLGVLAIIGVLSIGGIAGYSKAMNKYRVNKTADQVSQLAQNIRTLYASQKNYSTLSDNVIKKAHLAPEDMYESTNGTNLYNPFGGNVWISYDGKNDSGDNKAFYIDFWGLPQEACIDLLTQDWGTGASSGLISVGYSTGGAGYYGCTEGNNYVCANGGVMSVAKAVSLCTPNASDNAIRWKFY